MLCAMLVLLATAACTIAPEKLKPEWAMATSGEQYERLFWDSVKSKNWRDVEAHLSATIVTEAPGAVRNYQQTKEHIRQLEITDYSIGDINTQASGADLIVTYTITVHGVFDGKPVPDAPMRMMSVWQPVKRGVVMVAHTSMPSSP